MIYHYIISARIDRLITIWKRPTDGKKILRLTAAPANAAEMAVLRGIKCLSHTLGIYKLRL